MDYYNELYHHGVKGMKWGVRKRTDAFSAKATGHRIAAKVYDINAKAYKKSNKALSSMNAAARTTSLKKAEQAQAEANKRREAANTPEARKARVKKAVKVGAAVAGTALAAYGAYKVSKHIKSEAGKRSYESGKRYAEEHFFSEARKIGIDSASSSARRMSLEDAGRQTLKNTDRRTKKVSSSTVEAVKYLRHPERYQVDGELLRWFGVDD